MSIKNLYCSQPCKTCPFRKDSQAGWLGSARMKGITEQESFVCHNTISEDEPGQPSPNRKQCAGHMLLMKHENHFYMLADKMNLPLGLKGRELVFDTVDECVKHHE